jgi:predicted permease
MPDTSKWTGDLRGRLAELRLGPARELEIIEELSQHLDDRYDELRASGSSDAEARRLVIAELGDGGGLEQRMHALSQAHVTPPVVHGQPAAGLLRGLWQDVRYAMRTVRRQPGFAATIVVTIGLGIAVNTMVFTIANAAVLRPLPFEEAERLVRLGVTNVGNARNPTDGISYLDFRDWQAARQTFEQVAAITDRSVDISDDEHAAARVETAFASWNAFSLLRQPPALGRDFTEADDRIGAPPVVILSGNLWRVRYGADPAILGKSIRVAGTPSTVIGVMPGDFGFPDRVDIWLPLASLSEQERTSRDARRLDGLGRLRAGASIEQATTELSGITASLGERYPDTNRNITPLVTSLAIATQFVATVVALLGAVGFVLLIACANVANLLLARTADRSRDVTLRLALGASRWRIVRQLLVESLLLASLGGLVGLALAYPGIQFFQNLPPESAPPYWIRFTLDRTVFAYLLMLCVGSAIVCGLVPAWHASRTDLVAALNDAGRGSAGSRHRRRWTSAFVVAQVALAVVLLTGASLMMQNLIAVLRVDAGVETDGLLRTGFDLRRSDYHTERRLQFFSQLEERLASSPDVRAALATHAPLDGAFTRRLRIEGTPASDANTLPIVSLVRVGRRYFDVVGARAIAGRSFADSEGRLPDDGVVVNERFARMQFQDEPAIGKRILLMELNQAAPAAGDPRWLTIVGVVGNVRQSMLPSREFDPVVYAAYTSDPPQGMQVLLRSASGRAAANSLVSDHVRVLDRDLPVLPVRTTDEALAIQFWPQRIFGSMFAVLASVAMLLATCGLYAVTSYAVSRRTREIGVRVALGADARGVWWAVTGATLRQLAIGLVLGMAGAAMVATALPAFLIGTGGVRLFAFAGVVIALVAAGLAASAVPARRAMRLDPVAALQSE